MGCQRQWDPELLAVVRRGQGMDSGYGEALSGIWDVSSSSRIDGLWVQLEVTIFCNCGVPLTAAGDCDPWRHSQRSQQIPHNQQNS